MKLDILFHYDVDETTGEVKFIGKEEITVDTASTKRQAKKAVGVEDSSEPIIKLDSNKLILTSGAVQLMQVGADCRLDIKYKKIGKVTVPVIGTDTAFETKGGNKLTKNNTVSFRGTANEKLAEYGTTFTLEPTEDSGIFYLMGDKMDTTIPDKAIDIESELDLDALDEINIDDLESTDLSNFNFTL